MGGWPSGGPGVFGRPSWRSESGREVFTVVRKWLEGPSLGPRVVGIPFQSPGVVRMPYRRSWGGREALTEVRELS